MSTRRFLLLLGACLLVFLSFPPAFAQTRMNRQRAVDSVVQVIVDTRFGTQRRTSGYLFSASGYVVTSFHGVSDARRIQVFHARHGVFDVERFRRVDPRTDIAVLVLSHPENLQASPALLGDSRYLVAGDTLHAFHHPAFSDDAVYDTQLKAVGYVNQMQEATFTRQYADEMMLLEVEGPFDVGSAGGILCNDSYEVMGLLLGGRPASGGGPATMYALSSAYLAPLLTGTYDVAWSELETQNSSDAEYFDTFMGPAPKRLDLAGAMPEGYICWFGPTNHVSYGDEEFQSEINDKIDKNWFSSCDLVVDGRPITEWSASRIYVITSQDNPWNFRDDAGRYLHYDADSHFTKMIYKNRDTDERAMTRNILAMPLKPGAHTLSYQNKGANYKLSAVKRQRFKLGSAELKLLDIQDLSLVSMVLLPKPVIKAGEGKPVRYELERRPFQGKELNWSIRQVRLGLEQPKP